VGESGGAVFFILKVDVKLFVVVDAAAPFATYPYVDLLTLLLSHVLELGVLLLS
jgi:hypothetical protein